MRVHGEKYINGIMFENPGWPRPPPSADAHGYATLMNLKERFKLKTVAAVKCILVRSD